MLTLTCVDGDDEIVTLDFLNEEVTLSIYTDNLCDFSAWQEFDKSLDDNLSRKIKVARGSYISNVFLRYDNGKIVITIGNDSYLKGTYLKTVITLSHENLHTLKQLGELLKCIDNDTKYEWTDPPTIIKNARKN